MRLRRARAAVLAAGFIVTGASCGGSSSSPSAPVPSPTVAPTPTPAPSPSPSATAAPPTSAVCAYGFGTLETTCERRSAQHIAEVNAAINRLAQQHPEYFNTGDVNGASDAWRVLRPQEYYAGVVDELRRSQFCAETNQATVSVKNGDDFSETYDLLLSTGHVRRGDGAYRDTCSPPNFPIDPREAIAYVRVAFYSITCEEGITPPRNGENILPIGCRGFITATPKRRNNEDVPHHIIGENVSWRLEQSGDVVFIQDDDNNAFNKVATGRNAGRFTLCATSHGVEGCQTAEIVPDPRPR